MVVSTEKRDVIALIWIDNPPVNALSTAVRTGVIDALSGFESDSAIKAVVIACRGRTFIAGADITEFARGPEPAQRTGPDLQQVMEDYDKPIVAALHGTTLGGGFELALACDYRIAAPGTRVGLSEVKLGLLPGGGGTQRLPRLIGVKPALDAMLSGEPFSTEAALAVGAIDAIADGDVVEAAVRVARDHLGSERRRVSALTIDPASISASMFDAARAEAAKKFRNQHAPQRIIDCAEAAATLPFVEGRKVERENFIACRNDPQSQALQHVFFAERLAARVPGLRADAHFDPVESAAVIGAGTMGGGIAMCFANAGIPVILLDADRAGLDRGMAVIRRNYEISASRGKITAEQVDQRMALIKPSLEHSDLSTADIIVEAVFEDMAIKRDIFTTLDRVAKPDAILASNTSRLSINAMAEATERPQQVIGTHFFSPANVMRLCEVVRGSRTDPAVLARTLAVVRRIGKVGVVSADSDGFIGNRMLGPATQQANLMLLEGATPDQIDSAIREFGSAMGPFQVSDLAGLDIGYRSRRNYPPETIDWRAYAVSDKLVEAGRLGQKSGKGFYDYEGRNALPSHEVQDAIVAATAEYRIARRAFTPSEIVERYMLTLVNTGCDVLDEGVAYRASDIDIVYLTGYGHAAYHGGPMFWAEQIVGLPRALELIRTYSAATGEKWLRPSPLLERLVAAGKGFADFDVNPELFRHGS